VTGWLILLLARMAAKRCLFVQADIPAPWARPSGIPRTFYRRQRHWENDAYPRRLHGTPYGFNSASTRYIDRVLVLTKFTQGLPVAPLVTRPRFSRLQLEITEYPR